MLKRYQDHTIIGLTIRDIMFRLLALKKLNPYKEQKIAGESETGNHLKFLSGKF